MKRLAILLALLMATSAWGTTDDFPLKWFEGQGADPPNEVKVYVYDDTDTTTVAVVSLARATAPQKTGMWSGSTTVTLGVWYQFVYVAVWTASSDTSRDVWAHMVEDPADYAGASGADSGTVSRIVRRMWGQQLGAAGSIDSLTIDERTVNVERLQDSYSAGRHLYYSSIANYDTLDQVMRRVKDFLVDSSVGSPNPTYAPFQELFTANRMLGSPFAGASLIYNGGFEIATTDRFASFNYSDGTALDGWTADSINAGEGVLFAPTAHSGRRSFHLNSTANGDQLMLSSDLVKLCNEVGYIYGLWAKPNGELPYWGIAKVVDTLENVLDSIVFATDIGGDTTAWWPYAGYYAPPADTIVRIRLHVRIYQPAGGSSSEGIKIDDVFLLPTGPDSALIASADAGTSWGDTLRVLDSLINDIYDTLQAVTDSLDDQQWASSGSGVSEATVRDILGDSVPAYRVQIYDSGMTMIREFIDDAPHSADYGGSTSGGAGANPCTLIVINEGGTPIPSVFIRIKNSSQTTTIATSDNTGTDLNGKDYFSLDYATYKVYCGLAGYNQDTIPQTIAFAASKAFDTLTMTSMSPVLADSAGLCRVYGYVENFFSNRIRNARVEFKPITTKKTRYGNVLFLPTTRSVPTSSTGYFELYVTPSSRALGDTASNIFDSLKYDISIKYTKPEGGIEEQQLSPQGGTTIPDSSSLNLPKWLLPE